MTGLFDEDYEEKFARLGLQEQELAKVLEIARAKAKRMLAGDFRPNWLRYAIDALGMKRSADKYNIEWLKDALDYLNMNQSDLAKFLDVTSVSVSRWIKEEKVPAWAYLSLEGLSKGRLESLEKGLATSVVSNSSDFELAHNLAGSVRDCLADLATMRITGSKDHLSSGFDSIDSVWEGWIHPGAFIVVAAKTGIGKTAFCQQLSEQISTTGVSTLYFSLEMNHKELAWRTLSTLSGIPVRQLRSGNVDDEVKPLLAHARRISGDYAMKIVDNKRFVSDIVKYARQLHEFLRDTKQPLGAVFIDHMHIASAGLSNSTENTAMVSMALKSLAMELQVPVIAAAQYNRQFAYRDDKMPEITDLKNSSQIEQDADLVIDLHQMPSANGPSTKMMLRCLKSRIGFMDVPSPVLGMDPNTKKFYDAISG